MTSPNFILDGIEIVPKLPELPISTILFRKLKNLQHTKFEMIEACSGSIWKQQEALDKITRFAVNLEKLGIERGDLVAIISDNSSRSILASISVLLLGAKNLCLNPDYKINELRHFFKIATPKLVCCSTTILENIVALKENFGYSIICFDNVDAATLSYDQFISEVHQSQTDSFAPVDVGMDEVAMLMPSSGTTGLSKLVEIKHWGIHTTAEYSIDPNLLGINPDSSQLVYLPFFHVAGEMVTYGSLVAGCRMIIIDKFKSEEFLQYIETYRIESLFMVPSIAMFLAKTQLLYNYDTSSLKYIVCGGAPLKKEIERNLKTRLNIVSVRQTYGLTETSGFITMVSKGDSKPGSVGKLLSWVKLKICDVETGNIVGANEDGELRVKSRANMKGYYNDPEHTKATFDNDGWLKTGDLGYYDKDGFIFIVDRLKEMIKCRSFQIAPAELEGVLCSHPGVKEAGVIGIPHERLVEAPLAFVVRQPGCNVSELELIRYVAKNVSQQKHLTGGVRFVDEIPKSPSGKILRRKLRELLQKK